MSEECETINATLTGDQRDALQEIANIGMGQAGSSIARIWGEFVRLSIPRIANVERLDIPTVLQQLVGEKNILAVRQAFHGQIRGEVIIVFSGGPPRELAELMGYDDTDRVEEIELMLDVANILVGACLGRDHAVLVAIGVLAHIQPRAAQHDGALGHHHAAREHAGLLEFIVAQGVGLDVHGLGTVCLFGMCHARKAGQGCEHKEGE